MNELEEQSEQFSQADIDRFQQLGAQLHDQQNLPMGLIGGLVAAMIGAVLWAAITVATGWQIGFMAVGIGFLVGYAVSYLGKGITPLFGYMGALLALLGCLVGNYLTIIGLVANKLEMGYIETLTNLPMSLMQELMIENFSLIDLLFYGIAVYQGYKLSFTDLSAMD